MSKAGQMPWQHHFQPDQQTPSACAVCALGPDWHPEHQPREARLTLVEQERLTKLRGRTETLR